MDKQHLAREISNAAAAGFSFYVYTLADASGVFYIGKGKGGRLFQHKADAPNDANECKKHRIAGAGAALQHSIVAYFNDSAAAYRYEAELIGNAYGLTNIMLGDPLEPIERARMSAQSMLDRTVPFERWSHEWIPQKWFDIFKVADARGLYDLMRNSLLAEIAEPTPTSITIDGDGKCIAKGYNEDHGGGRKPMFRRKKVC